MLHPVREIIEHQYAVPRPQQQSRDVGTDVSRTTGHQNPHEVQVTRGVVT